MGKGEAMALTVEQRIAKASDEVYRTYVNAESVDNGAMRDVAKRALWRSGEGHVDPVHVTRAVEAAASRLYKAGVLIR